MRFDIIRLDETYGDLGRFRPLNQVPRLADRLISSSTGRYFSLFHIIKRGTYLLSDFRTELTRRFGSDDLANIISRLPEVTTSTTGYVISQLYIDSEGEYAYENPYSSDIYIPTFFTRSGIESLIVPTLRALTIRAVSSDLEGDVDDVVIRLDNRNRKSIFDRQGFQRIDNYSMKVYKR